MESERLAMLCSKANQQLQLYIDGQLTLKEIRALEMHLSDCEVCLRNFVLLEEVENALRGFESIAEPADLAQNIMQRVALNPQNRGEPSYILLKPSLSEWLTVVILATVTMLGIILGQPALRAALPIANGHDMLSLAFIEISHMLLDVNSSTLMLSLWIIGTFLGIWITLVLAGSEIRSEWYKAMMKRLPM